jgi:hypothetical protein
MLSPFPVREALHEGRSQASQGWRKWFLDLYTTVNGLLASVAALTTDLAALGTSTVVPFVAGNFVGQGGLTWTVTAPNVATNRVIRLGRTRLWTCRLAQTTVAGGAAPPATLAITVPLGETVVGTWAVRAAFALDNGAEVGALVEVSGTTAVIANRTTLTWANSTAATWVYFQIAYEVTP